MSTHPPTYNPPPPTEVPDSMKSPHAPDCVCEACLAEYGIGLPHDDEEVKRDDGR